MNLSDLRLYQYNVDGYTIQKLVNRIIKDLKQIGFLFPAFKPPAYEEAKEQLGPVEEVKIQSLQAEELKDVINIREPAQ